MRFGTLACSLDMTPEDPATRHTVDLPDESVIFTEAARRVVTSVQMSPAEVEEHYRSIQSRLGQLEIPLRTRMVPAAVGYMAPKAGGEAHRWLWRSEFFKPQPLRREIWSTAAIVVLGIAVVLMGWNAGMRHIGQHARPAMLTYTTANGERGTITLPDGGTVALNVASRLEVPLDYMAGNHTVRLIGEGLFTVSHHDRIPLTVIAGGTAARVLGTAFVVRRYATDTATLVAVREGKVAIGSVVVAAAQAADVGRDGVPHVRSSDASPFTFATGVLTIDGLPLPDAIVELDRWYDADIRLGDPRLATQFLKGKNAAGSLGDLAEILALTLDVRVVRNGRVLTLFPR